MTHQNTQERMRMEIRVDIARKMRDLVCELMGVSVEEVISKSRRRPIVETRKMAAYIMYKLSGATYSEIGELLGHKNHCAPRHACITVSGYIDVDPKYREIIGPIMSACEGVCPKWEPLPDEDIFIFLD